MAKGSYREKNKMRPSIIFYINRPGLGAPNSDPNPCMVQTSEPKSAGLPACFVKVLVANAVVALASPMDCSLNRFLLSLPPHIDTVI